MRCTFDTESGTLTIDDEAADTEGGIAAWAALGRLVADRAANWSAVGRVLGEAAADAILQADALNVQLPANVDAWLALIATHGRR